jgi:hypothetical protein
MSTHRVHECSNPVDFDDLDLFFRHLIEAHCPEGWEPVCFSLGADAFEDNTLFAAAEPFGYPVVRCEDPYCSDRGHVLLVTQRLPAPWPAGGPRRLSQGLYGDSD